MSNRSITSKFKEIGNHGIVYGIGTALESLISFLLIPLFLNKFPPDLYGSFALIQLSATMASSFFYFGASSSLSRFYFESDSPEKKKIWFSNTLFLTFIGGFIMSGLALLLGKIIVTQLFENDELTTTFYFLFISFSISIVNTTFYILIRLLKKSIWFIALKFLSLVATLGFMFLFISVMKNIAEATALGFLSGQIAIVILMFLKLNSSIILKIDFKIIKKYLSFGVPIAISSLVILLLDWVVRYFINKDLGKYELGIYSMAFKLGALVQAGYIIPFALIWSTIRMEYRKDENTSAFFNKVSTYYLVVGVGIIFFISIFLKSLIGLISSSSNYDDSFYLVPILLLSQMVWGTVNILDYGMYINNKTKHYVYYDLISLLVISILSLLFIKQIGLLGAAFINLIGNLIVAGSIYLKSNTYFRITINFKQVFASLGIAFIIYYSSVYLLNIETFGNLIKFFINSGIALLFTSIMYFIIPKSEKDIFIGLIGNVLKKVKFKSK